MGILKGALLGVAIGAGAAAFQAYRDDQPVDQLAKHAATWGAGGAVSGGLLGLVTSRRCRAARNGASRPSAAFSGAAVAARPYLERGAEATRRQRKAARRAAHEQVERAVKMSRRQRKAARQQVERAVKMSRRQRKAATLTAVHAVHAARTQVDQATRSTRHRARRVAGELSSRIPA